MSRKKDLRDALGVVRRRIERAAQSAGRSAADVTLIAVTKFFPASDVRLLHELGVRDVGENKAAEAAAKAGDVADLGLRWHFIGQLQSNKAARVASFAHAVHSVDRSSLVKQLGKATAEREHPLDCLIQVSLDGAEGRGGTASELVVQTADRIAQHDGLRVAGVMAVAPLGHTPESAFERLASCSERLRAAYPQATLISSGMSGDLEAAVKYGATHVRIGAAILGERPKLG